MFEWNVLYLFLYFPEDKSEYIPSAIILVFFIIAAFLAFRIITRISKREAAKAKELEESLKKPMNNSEESSSK